MIFLAVFLVGCTAEVDNNIDIEDVLENGEIETNDETSQDADVEAEQIIVEDSNIELKEGITKEELSSNNDGSSCWVAYQGKVYDLTEWLRQHPGGAQAILPNCGTAEQFENAYNARHGERDDGLLRNQPIGDFLG